MDQQVFHLKQSFYRFHVILIDLVSEMPMPPVSYQKPSQGREGTEVCIVKPILQLHDEQSKIFSAVCIKTTRSLNA